MGVHRNDDEKNTTYILQKMFVLEKIVFFTKVFLIGVSIGVHRNYI